jgi:NIMA-interacting peptidyl-prolyl cis-trans isomerase 1
MAENFSTTGPLAAAAAGKEEGKIRCAHLLVKHNESRRPSSWKQVGVAFRTKGLHWC